jgi:hypothetical protein
MDHESESSLDTIPWRTHVTALLAFFLGVAMMIVAAALEDNRPLLLGIFWFVSIPSLYFSQVYQIRTGRKYKYQELITGVGCIAFGLIGLMIFGLDVGGLFLPVLFFLAGITEIVRYIIQRRDILDIA